MANIVSSDHNSGEPPTSNQSSTFRERPGIFVGIQHDELDVVDIMSRVKSPKAGAVVLFAGM